MKRARRSSKGITVVAPTGRIDELAAAALAADLEAGVSVHDSRIVVDMSDVPYIGSKGLQALVAVLAACQRSGGDLKLAAVNPDVMHILRMIRFDELFSLCDGIEEAIAEFA